MEPEVRLLRYFLAVAEEQNFTRAAERLHIAQPSLSAQIRRLEAQLGVPLLRRSTREVSLTEAGRELMAHGPAALTGMDRAWESARQAGRGVVGTLRLAYPLSAGHDTVPRLLQALREEYPRITVGSDILPTSEVLLAVRNRRANVGIARTPAPMDGVRLQPLRHDRVGVLVCADHPLADKAEVDLDTVAQFPVTLNPRPANPSLYDFMVDLFASRKLRPSWVERDQAFELSQHLITSGAATALVGQSTATSLPTNLRWIPLAEQVTFTMTLVLPADAHAPTATCFHQVALAYASAHDWLH